MSPSDFFNYFIWQNNHKGMKRWAPRTGNCDLKQSIATAHINSFEKWQPVVKWQKQLKCNAGKRVWNPEHPTHTTSNKTKPRGKVRNKMSQVRQRVEGEELPTALGMAALCRGLSICSCFSFFFYHLQRSTWDNMGKDSQPFESIENKIEWALKYQEILAGKTQDSSGRSVLKELQFPYSCR